MKVPQAALVALALFGGTSLGDDSAGTPPADGTDGPFPDTNTTPDRAAKFPIPDTNTTSQSVPLVPGCPDAANAVCMEVYAPVCGSDGITYSNSCYFGLAQCGRPNLQVAKQGECGDGVVPDTFNVTSPGETGVPVDVSAVSMPQTGDGTTDSSATMDLCSDPANVNCPAELDPACGSDGITYSNSCYFGLAQCDRPDLEVANQGVCEEGSIMSEYEASGNYTIPWVSDDITLPTITPSFFPTNSPSSSPSTSHPSARPSFQKYSVIKGKYLWKLQGHCCDDSNKSNEITRSFLGMAPKMLERLLEGQARHYAGKRSGDDTGVKAEVNYVKMQPASMEISFVLEVTFKSKLFDVNDYVIGFHEWFNNSTQQKEIIGNMSTKYPNSKDFFLFKENPFTFFDIPTSVSIVNPTKPTEKNLFWKNKRTFIITGVIGVGVIILSAEIMKKIYNQRRISNSSIGGFDIPQTCRSLKVGHQDERIDEYKKGEIVVQDVAQLV